ncbi:GPW/gp25 family protein [Ralstonia pseudosolanacearum]|uniref:GPW/gp25 family protein n=1 Tax=Ralstonia pseudosolanacearum TaxID=1310165 RepID=UPI003CF4E6F9
MTGMNATTGRALESAAHIAQSMRDILTTPIGSRVMRRDYGSQVPDLIDQPLNPATRLRTMSAAVTAIVRWEPRVRVSSVRFWIDASGKPVLDVEAERIDGPRRESLGVLSIPVGG